MVLLWIVRFNNKLLNAIMIIVFGKDNYIKLKITYKMNVWEAFNVIIVKIYKDN